MRAETISVGTEILLGNIVNTNAAYLAGQYALLGIDSFYQTTVGDNSERLKEAVKLAASRSDLIVLTGGLGPTQDDITKIIVRKIKQDRSNNEKIGVILKTYGVSKVSDLPAAKYEAFLTDISQI